MPQQCNWTQRHQWSGRFISRDFWFFIHHPARLVRPGHVFWLCRHHSNALAANATDSAL